MYDNLNDSYSRARPLQAEAELGPEKIVSIIFTRPKTVNNAAVGRVVPKSTSSQPRNQAPPGAPRVMAMTPTTPSLMTAQAVVVSV